ncbi:MAG: sugar phosphate isomerase/epimerase family protein [Christensenella sp.]
MKYKFASADFTFPLLEHDKVIKLVGLLGFDGIDIGLFENRGHLQPSAVFSNTAQNGKLLKRKTEDSGIVVADVFLQCDIDFEPKAINHPDAKIRAQARDWFLHTLEYANACGSKHVTCLPGVHFEAEDYETSFARAKEELAWRALRAKDAGLIFGTETHLGSLGDTPQKTERLMRETKGLTLTLDYTHFATVGIPDSEVEPLIKYATHFHARGAAKGVLQAVVAENTIDYARIVEVMQEVGYKGFIGVEYIWMEWQNANRVDNISEGIQLREIMKKAMK